jgi:hypothetical protein
MEFTIYEKMWNDCIKPKINKMVEEDDDLLLLKDN